jgi:GAF domain-containing protein
MYATAERALPVWHAEGGWEMRGGFEPASESVDLAVDLPGHATHPAIARHPDERALPPAVFEQLLQSARPLVVRDVAQHPSLAQDPLIQAWGVRSLVGLPIDLRGQRIGLLYLENREAPMRLEAAQIACSSRWRMKTRRCTATSSRWWPRARPRWNATAACCRRSSTMRRRWCS